MTKFDILYIISLEAFVYLILSKMLEVLNSSNNSLDYDVVRKTSHEVNNLKKDIECVIDEKLLIGVPDNIKEIAINKILKDPIYASEIVDKYEKINGKKPDFFPFFCAYRWYEKLKKTNWYILLVDYSKPAYTNRCYLINMRTNSVEITTTCEQWTWKKGKNQPGFSNLDKSWQSSLGISQTEQSNPTRNFWIWDSLIVSWKEDSNSLSAARHILVHKWNVSHWCFVFKDKIKWTKIINKLANYGTIFSYYPDADYLKKSNYV